MVTACLALNGCAHYRDLPPGMAKVIDSPVVEREMVQVAAMEQKAPPPADYVIGPNDALVVNVGNRPDFTASLLAAGNNGKPLGNRVDGSGDIRLPLAGAIHVAGLTLSQVKGRIQEAMKKYYLDPWVTVEIADYKSQPLYLIGQFKLPGTYYMDRPLNLVQGIALGSGPDPISGDLRGAKLTRDGKIMPVDIYDLLMRGDTQQNIWLQPGDTIYIPDGKNQQVFVFGAVKRTAPVTFVPIPPAGLDLTQAVASVDLRDVGYDIKHVRIIRSLSTTRGELIVVDLDKILRGEALSFPLMGGDVIYVPKSTFGTWNDAINEILPTLQAISGLLQPFVNIAYFKYLTRN